MDDLQTLGLGGAAASQDDDALSPDLEKAIERSGELSEDVIVLDDEEGVVQVPEKTVHDEMVLDPGAQQLDQPEQAVPPPPVADDPMMEDPKPK